MSSDRIAALVAFGVILTASTARAQPDLSQATIKVTPVTAGVYMLDNIHTRAPIRHG